MNKNLDILVYLRDVAPWGHKHLLSTLSKAYNIILVVSYKLDDDTRNFIKEKSINVIAFKPNFWMRNIEELLLNLVRKNKTTNYKFGIKRNILSRKGFNKLKAYLAYLLIPKVFSPTFISKILGLIPSKFDTILKSVSPEFFLYQAFLVPYNYLPARANKFGLKVYSLVYSWDNPFKYNFLPTGFNKYFVWNETMKEDLQSLHEISKNKQYTIGPLQFDYLNYELKNHLYNNSTISFINDKKNNYALFLFCMAGTAAIQEVQLFKHIYEIIFSVDPKIFILARPYPNANDHTVYNELTELPNVFLDVSVNKGLKQDEMDIFLKKLSIENAKYIINTGTTMALEASILKKPVLQIAYLPKTIVYSRKRMQRPLDIDYIYKNDHLNKYLFRKDFTNVAFNDEQLRHLAYCLMKDEFEQFRLFTVFLRSLSLTDYKREAADSLLDFLDVASN